MPYAIFDYMGAFLRNSFAHVDNVIPVIKTITWLLLSRLQLNKPHRNSPEPSDPCLRNLSTRAGTLQNPPEPSETFRNLPEPTSWTYARIHRNPPKSSGTCLRNLHHFTPELSGTFRNLPPEPCTLHRNSPEPSGTRLRNLHQHTPELSGTFRNLPPEPAPAARTGTHRSLSGLKTPLISLRCWGKTFSPHLPIIARWRESIFHRGIRPGKPWVIAMESRPLISLCLCP